MTIDFRALCAELTDEFEDWICYGNEFETSSAHELVDRARAALAEPYPPINDEVPKTAYVFNTYIIPSPKDYERLLKFLNLYYLGDEDANHVVDGKMVAKYPEKETEEFKDAVRKAGKGFPLALSIEMDVNGNFRKSIL
jgi:hypothetical protein